MKNKKIKEIIQAIEEIKICLDAISKEVEKLK